MAGLAILCIVFQSLALTQCESNETGEPLKKAILWKITGETLNQPSYLFGSIHLLDSADFFLHKTVIEQLRRSDVLVLETNMDEPGYQQAALQQAMMEEDSLSGLLDTAAYREINDFFMDRYNIPLKALDKMKPFYVASMISALSADASTKSHETEFIRIAHEEDKPVRGIATIKTESEILGGIPMDVQVKYLLKEIEKNKEGSQEEKKEKLFDAYNQGDLVKIESLMMESVGAFPEIHNAMFIRRNQVWIPLMENMMIEESCFFVTGVGHLPGESGIIKLLREEGYNVRPVKMDFWFHD